MTAKTKHDFRVDRPAATLRRSVTESIRQAIATGHFNAGDRMPERDLCDMTGVSRTLVREALRQLESEGLIHVIAHKGPVVATITAEQAAGIYQVREVLEGLAAEQFAIRANDDHRAALHTAFGEVQSAYDTGDVLMRLSAKNRFYDCLIDGAGNEALGSSLFMLNSRAMILRGRSLQMPARAEKSLQELKALIAALDERDGKKAHKMAVAHVRSAAETVMQSYQTVEE
ncbi:MAG: GntR family transcriptional regulator [Rhizobiaceae bacterium]|nr:GntR family transcriptional regulator [Rhizobiaceae bacterium]MBL4696598.1 GntR family transcriptional regulator [Rhizobiaceae bacterium]